MRPFLLPEADLKADARGGGGCCWGHGILGDTVQDVQSPLFLALTWRGSVPSESNGSLGQ